MSTRLPGLGSAAPPLDLPTATGERRSLTEFRGHPVMVSFLGAAHCAFCRAHVLRLIQARREFETAGAEVVLVAYDDPSLLTAQMLRDLQVPFVLLLDRGREAYPRWGLGRARWTARLRPGLYWAGVKLMLQGGSDLGPPAPDPSQLGGDFVVDRAGRLAFANRLKSFYDRAPIDRLIDVLRRT